MNSLKPTPKSEVLKNTPKNRLSVVLMAIEASSSLVNGFFMFFVGVVFTGMQKTGLNSFISDYHLGKFLDEKKLRVLFDRKEIKCPSCGDIITKNSLGIIVDKTDPDFICRKPVCSLRYERKMREFN